ncbi:aminoglycoside nucleotidyltransferase [Glycomyces scopariae]
MNAQHLLALLDAMRRNGIDVWIGGGWGVDALLGEQTRPHRDLDLMHRAEHEDALTALLQDLGYTETLDWRPVRFVMTAPGGPEIDLHPLVFGPDGAAVQSSFDPGAPFRYPADAFTTGTVDGTPVPCLSAAQQNHFHQGYEPTDRDRQDMARLRRAFGIATHF